MSKDNLGDRMKTYEMIEANRMLIPNLPVVIRLDGKAFHTFTKGLQRPYDKRLTDLMVDTTKFIVNKTNAVIGYTQSDEISLILNKETDGSEIFFNGRIQKLTSVVASMVTAFFNRNLPLSLPEKADKFAYFDCRVWNVPNEIEAINAIVWRELDATKNAISMAAQHYFSHKELQGKHSGEMQEMLFKQKNINFNDYPSFFKRGSYIRRLKKEIAFTVDEINNLPTKHEAHTNPNLKIIRSVIERIELPPMNKVINKLDVIFNGQPPLLLQETL